MARGIGSTRTLAAAAAAERRSRSAPTAASAPSASTRWWQPRGHPGRPADAAGDRGSHRLRGHDRRRRRPDDGAGAGGGVGCRHRAGRRRAERGHGRRSGRSGPGHRHRPRPGEAGAGGPGRGASGARCERRAGGSRRRPRARVHRPHRHRELAIELVRPGGTVTLVGMTPQGAAGIVRRLPASSRTGSGSSARTMAQRCRRATSRPLRPRTSRARCRSIC